MLRYHLGWVDEEFRPAQSDPGKRIRARLCMLACEASGGRAEQALQAATAVELIHNFSLIHDDIQDRSELRRHRRTVWSIWGEAQAINAGDEMFVLAQLALLEADSEPSTTIRAIRALNEACRLLCEGQYLDLDFERRTEVSVAEYYAMIERKTAALIEAACRLGAIFGSGSDEVVAALAGFGRLLGLAFQVRDDYLGIWGTPGQTGKAAADDVASKKKTLPLLYALERSDAGDRETLRAILDRPGRTSAGELATALAILDHSGAAAYTAAEAERTSAQALEVLFSTVPDSPARQELADLCRKLAGRAK
jgi:geranylgeranyl diphosphate synthase type I